MTRLQAVPLSFPLRSCERVRSTSEQKLGRAEVSECEVDFCLPYFPSLPLRARSQDRRVKQRGSARTERMTATTIMTSFEPGLRRKK